MSADLLPMLTPALVLFPVAAAVAVVLLPSRWAGRVSLMAALVLTGAVVVTIIGVVSAADTGAGEPPSITLSGWPAPLGIELVADPLAAVMLGLTAAVVLGVLAAATATEKVRGGPAFWPLSLTLWAALNAVYLAGDLFNAYVALELMGLSAVGLIALGGRDAWRPALRYLLVAVLGSLLYLLGIALLYGETATLDTSLVAQRIEPGAAPVVALGLMTAGLALKTALVPLHGWLPPAHAAAPAAVSPMLSALVIKASFVLTVRVWTMVLPGALGDATAPLAVATTGLGALGAIAVLWGGLCALRQRQLKRVVAYSTVAQVGYLMLFFPLVTPALLPGAGTETLDAARDGWSGVWLVVLSHGLAKAAMFLAAGNLLLWRGSPEIGDLTGAITHRQLDVAAFAVAGISLAGMPPTFGFAGKWQLLMSSLHHGQWWWAVVLVVGGLLTFGYVAKVVRATFAPPQEADAHSGNPVPRRLTVVAVALAASALVLGLFPMPFIELADAGLLLDGPVSGGGS